MPVARLTSKGQVTVPKSIRDTLGLQRGDLLMFVPTPEGSVQIRRLPGRPLSQLHAVVGVSRGVPHAQERKVYRRALATRLGKRRPTT